MEENTATNKRIFSRGANFIKKERLRQISVEGWGAEHDDSLNCTGELLDAAVAYILEDPTEFPWDRQFFKPNKDHVRNLEKAGALIAAEIDRLLRKRENERNKNIVE